MFSNRLSQSFNPVYLRRNALSIYLLSYRTNVNSKPNLIASNILSSKCRPFLINSLCSPVRQFFSFRLKDSPDSFGEIDLLRGVQGIANFSDIPVPSLLKRGQCLYHLVRVLNQDVSSQAMTGFETGFNQAFHVLVELLCQRNTDDLNKDWLEPTAQEDARDIINQMPAGSWKIAQDFAYSAPYCLGYKVHREEAPSFVDTTVLHPCIRSPLDSRLLYWRLVYTRKFGEGINDSWNIKHVAVTVYIR